MTCLQEERSEVSFGTFGIAQHISDDSWNFMVSESSVMGRHPIHPPCNSRNALLCWLEGGDTRHQSVSVQSCHAHACYSRLHKAGAAAVVSCIDSLMASCGGGVENGELGWAAAGIASHVGIEADFHSSG